MKPMKKLYIIIAVFTIACLPKKSNEKAANREMGGFWNQM